MAITAAGVGSGLDIAAIVNQLVAAERAPQATRISTARSKPRSESVRPRPRTGRPPGDSARMSILSSAITRPSRTSAEAGYPSGAWTVNC